VHVAVMKGHVRFLRCLLEEHKFPREALDYKDEWGRTPAHIAAEGDDPNLLHELAIHGGAMHLPAGTERKKIALVKLHNDVTYRLGRVFYTDPRKEHVKFEYIGTLYEEPKQEQHLVPIKDCIWAPTPLVLAKCLGRTRAQKELEKIWTVVANNSGVEEKEALAEAEIGSLPAGHLVSRGRWQDLKKLVRDGTINSLDLRRRDGLGRTTLHCAARTGTKDALQAVLDLFHFEPQDLCAVDDKRWNAVHHAAASGDAECLRAAVSMHSNPQELLLAEDEWYRTPLDVAVEADAGSAVQTLIEMGSPWHRPLGCWSEQRQKDNVALVCFKNSTAGPWAWQLARAGNDFDDGCDRFSFSYADGKYETLVEAERYIPMPTPAVLADKEKRKSAAKVLRTAWEAKARELGVNPQLAWDAAKDGMLPAGLWARHSHADDLSGILEAGVLEEKDLAQSDCQGRTSLHWAAASGSPARLHEVASRLKQDDLLAKDLRGRTALHHAAASGSADCVKALCMETGQQSLEDLDCVDRWQQTPLHAAAAMGAAQAACALIEESKNSKELCGKQTCAEAIREGAIVHVSQESSGTGPSWKIGRLRCVAGSEVEVKYMEGGKESKVHVDRLKLNPTPLGLATNLRHQEAVRALVKKQHEIAFNRRVFNTAQAAMRLSATNKFHQTWSHTPSSMAGQPSSSRRSNSNQYLRPGRLSTSRSSSKEMSSLRPTRPPSSIARLISREVRQT